MRLLEPSSSALLKRPGSILSLLFGLVLVVLCFRVAMLLPGVGASALTCALLAVCSHLQKHRATEAASKRQWENAQRRHLAAAPPGVQGGAWELRLLGWSSTCTALTAGCLLGVKRAASQSLVHRQQLHPASSGIRAGVQGKGWGWRDAAEGWG